MAIPDLTERCPALLVIDPQCDFVTTGGSVAVEGSTESLANISTLIQAAHEVDMPVIFTQEVHRKEHVDFGRELDGDEGVHCVEGTEGVAFRSETSPRDGDFLVPKRRYSGFFATDLDLLLRGLGVDTVLLCGFLADVCVHYTAADAHQHDYHVFVAEDGTTGSTLEARRASLAAIDYLQHGSVVTSGDLIAGLRAGFRRRPAVRA